MYYRYYWYKDALQSHSNIRVRKRIHSFRKTWSGVSTTMKTVNCSLFQILDPNLSMRKGDLIATAGRPLGRAAAEHDERLRSIAPVSSSQKPPDRAQRPEPAPGAIRQCPAWRGTSTATNDLVENCLRGGVDCFVGFSL